MSLSNVFQLCKNVSNVRLCQMTNKTIPKVACLLNSFLSTRVTYKRLVRNMSTISENVFKGTMDRFNGVIVQSKDEKCDRQLFSKKLEDSLESWKENGKRGIWFKVNLEDTEWVPILAKNGFKFHHAKENYVMMYLWLPKNETCNVPQYAHTMTGVGAVVVNDKSQILVVREKYFVGKEPMWKLPGGYVEPGENFVDAAIREVFEETGVKTKFNSVLALRHGHGGMFECSDVYTVVSLAPLTSDISRCEREIEACEWMDVNEYLNHPKVHELNRFFVQKHVDYQENDIKIDCHHGIHVIVNRPYTLYHVMTKDIGEPDLKGPKREDSRDDV